VCADYPLGLGLLAIFRRKLRVARLVCRRQSNAYDPKTRGPRENATLPRAERFYRRKGRIPQ